MLAVLHFRHHAEKFTGQGTCHLVPGAGLNHGDWFQSQVHLKPVFSAALQYRQIPNVALQLYVYSEKKPPPHLNVISFQIWPISYIQHTIVNVGGWGGSTSKGNLGYFRLSAAWALANEVTGPSIVIMYQGDSVAIRSRDSKCRIA